MTQKEAAKGPGVMSRIVLMLICLGMLCAWIFPSTDDLLKSVTGFFRSASTEDKKESALDSSSSSPVASPYVAPSPAAEAPSQTPISDVQWSEIDKIYKIGSNMTDLQKDEIWKKYEGKRVKWSGKVAAMSDDWAGLKLQVKMKETTFTADVIVDLEKSEKEKAIRFHEGDPVTFIGSLKSWGTLTPIWLKDGEIVSE